MQQRERRLCRRIAERNEEDIRNRRLCRQEILLLQCEQDALQSCRKTDGGGGIPSELLDQSVIASAPRHGTLCTERRIGNLERRPRVVVESPHKARIELIGNACCRQMLLYLRKVLRASRA